MYNKEVVKFGGNINFEDKSVDVDRVTCWYPLQNLKIIVVLLLD